MKYIDLTQTFTSTTPVYPGDPIPVLEERGILERDGFSDWHLSTGMHVGTHIDGPLHMVPNAKPLHEFDVSNFIGKGVVVDVRGQKTITAATLSQTKFNGARIALIFTGWSDRYGREEYYHDYPVLTADAAEFLVAQNISMVGLDAPSPDQPPFPVHKIFLQKNIFIIENLTNLAALDVGKQFQVFALPLKVTADSALSRVVAVED